MVNVETKQIEFAGFSAFEMITKKIRMVVVTGTGPRVAFFGKPGGINLFSWYPADIGRGDWKLHGGHRVWITRPGADEAEDTYGADNGACTVEEAGGELIVTGGIHPFLRICRGLQIKQMDEVTFQVTNFLRNDGNMLYSGGVWAVTCTRPIEGTSYGIPLGDRSRAWDLIKVVIPRQWGGNVCKVDDPQFKWTDDLLIVRPQGSQSKRMLFAPLGAIIMSNPGEGISFIKQSISVPGGHYPLDCNLAVFIGNNNFTVEMESYGAEQTVQPGETIENIEIWKVVEEVFDWQDLEKIQKHTIPLMK